MPEDINNPEKNSQENSEQEKMSKELREIAYEVESGDNEVEGELEEMSPEDYENMMGENLTLMKNQLLEKRNELEKLKNKKRLSKKDKAKVVELEDTIAFMEEEINNREEFLGENPES